MDIITKEELEDKLKEIKKNISNEEKFLLARTDYLTYVGKSKELSRIIRKLAFDNKIPKNLLQEIFNLSRPTTYHQDKPTFNIPIKPMALGYFRHSHKPKQPPFWSDELEEKFKLYKNYLDLWKFFTEGQKMPYYIKKELKNGDNKKENFSLEKYLQEELTIVQKLHENIIEKIYPPELLKKKKVIIKTFTFDEKKSVLSINGIDIRITNPGKQHELLKVMFKEGRDLCEEWFYDDIADELGEDIYSESKETIKKIRISFKNAAYQLNQRIAFKTNLSDFFIINPQSFRINSDFSIKKTKS